MYTLSVHSIQQITLITITIEFDILDTVNMLILYSLVSVTLNTGLKKVKSLNILIYFIWN